MKIEFIKEHKFYLPSDVRTMHIKECGDVMELDNVALCEKWINRGIVKSCEKVAAIEVPEEPKYENKMEDVEAKEEKKPAPRKRRTRKPAKKAK